MADPAPGLITPTLPDGAALRTHQAGPGQLETFACAPHVAQIEFVTDEWMSRCPVTGQPDFGRLTITYQPRLVAIESKSLKLWLHGLHGQEAFVEWLASYICQHVAQVVTAPTRVVFEQSIRGGLAETVTAEVTP